MNKLSNILKNCEELFNVKILKHATPDHSMSSSVTTATSSQTKSKRLTPDEKREIYLHYGKEGLSISKEFLKQIALGEAPFCTYPWKRLDIVSGDNRTKVCSDFPTRLPVFNWPTTEDFHNENNMWNHPFMQYMRQNMGTTSAVPYCDLCVRANKRSPKNFDWRDTARSETKKIFTKIESERIAKSYRGCVNKELVNSYNELLWKQRSTVPFHRSIDEYRKQIWINNLHNSGSLLQIGVKKPAYSIFLAEANENLDIADFSKDRLKLAANTLEHFGLSTSQHHLNGSGKLPFADSSFNAVWIDGEIIYSANREFLFSELRRILKPNSRLHVNRAFSVGELLRRFLNAPTNLSGCEVTANMSADNNWARQGEDILQWQADCVRSPHFDELELPRDANQKNSGRQFDAIAARSALICGQHYSQPGNFFYADSVRRVLRKLGVTLDVIKGISVNRLPTSALSKLSLAFLANDHELTAALKQYGEQNPYTHASLATYSAFISFNAIVNKETQKKVPST
ncbi:Methyltransferase domain protein [Pseudovibrio axinellae]|uniref:Methyltransferase domain protein n=1 Tax=Pseudovibrio axinellae TaxID=989403 RepID=A0A165T2F0_9HYPH|nr:class I SAM-dependent methyltransferase [Pseudovibrio axinellae]KZL05222.1 Methyltransferase domain protein [Pseudovibrio axinellae]SER31666.1 Methyltransferase domain-containing protein [Pseudovibrio axinellae]